MINCNTSRSCRESCNSCNNCMTAKCQKDLLVTLMDNMFIDHYEEMKEIVKELIERFESVIERIEALESITISIIERLERVESEFESIKERIDRLEELAHPERAIYLSSYVIDFGEVNKIETVVAFEGSTGKNLTEVIGIHTHGDADSPFSIVGSKMTKNGGSHTVYFRPSTPGKFEECVVFYSEEVATHLILKGSYVKIDPGTISVTPNTTTFDMYSDDPAEEKYISVIGTNLLEPIDIDISSNGAGFITYELMSDWNSMTGGTIKIICAPNGNVSPDAHLDQSTIATVLMRSPAIGDVYAYGVNTIYYKIKDRLAIQSLTANPYTVGMGTGADNEVLISYVDIIGVNLTSDILIEYFDGTGSTSFYPNSPPTGRGYVITQEPGWNNRTGGTLKIELTVPPGWYNGSVCHTQIIATSGSNSITIDTIGYIANYTTQSLTANSYDINLGTGIDGSTLVGYVDVTGINLDTDIAISWRVSDLTPNPGWPSYGKGYTISYEPGWNNRTGGRLKIEWAIPPGYADNVEGSTTITAKTTDGLHEIKIEVKGTKNNAGGSSSEKSITTSISNYPLRNSDTEITVIGLNLTSPIEWTSSASASAYNTDGLWFEKGSDWNDYTGGSATLKYNCFTGLDCNPSMSKTSNWHKFASTPDGVEATITVGYMKLTSDTDILELVNTSGSSTEEDLMYDRTAYVVISGVNLTKDITITRTDSLDGYINYRDWDSKTGGEFRIRGIANAPLSPRPKLAIVCDPETATVTISDYTA